MTSTAPRRRLEPAQRRAQIIEVTTSLIATSGYNALTLSRVAEECGITRAGIFHHFESKEDLFVAVLQARDEQDRVAIERDLEVAQSPGLRPLLDALVRRNHGQREIVRLYTMLAAESLDPQHPAHQYFAERLAWNRLIIANTAAGLHPDPPSLAIQILVIMDGLQLNWIRDPSIDFEATWSGFADRILGNDSQS